MRAPRDNPRQFSHFDTSSALSYVIRPPSARTQGASLISRHGHERIDSSQTTTARLDPGRRRQRPNRRPRAGLRGRSGFMPCCKTVGKIPCDGPRIPTTGPGGRQSALNDDLCVCQCSQSPRLIALQAPRLSSSRPML